MKPPAKANDTLLVFGGGFHKKQRKNKHVGKSWNTDRFKKEASNTEDGMTYVKSQKRQIVKSLLMSDMSQVLALSLLLGLLIGWAL